MTTETLLFLFLLHINTVTYCLKAINCYSLLAFTVFCHYDLRQQALWVRQSEKCSLEFRSKGIICRLQFENINNREVAGWDRVGTLPIKEKHLLLWSVWDLNALYLVYILCFRVSGNFTKWVPNLKCKPLNLIKKY